MNVFITDLRYDYNGALSSDVMPLGIGYMKSFMLSRLEYVNVELFAYPNELEKHIGQTVPDVLLMSNYMWNQKLNLHFAKEIKKRNPNSLIILGGPNFSLDDQEKKDFLIQHPFVDLYVTGEGDFYATELVNLFHKCNGNIETFYSNELHSCFYIHPLEGFFSLPQKSRSKNLEDIPSPWLTGVMDQFFDGRLTPMIETNRGCPFTCTFCVQGQSWYTKVNYFPLERIKEEIWYIGEKMISSPIHSLVIADSNFGMFDRDIEISETIAQVQKKYQWPIVITATTGKNKPERIIQSIEKLNGALVMYQAVQSLDFDVLVNVKRSNIRLDAYEKLQTYIRGRGLRSNSDVILGLPGETFDKHVYSLTALINSGTNNLTSFQAILLNGSEMNTLDTKNNFGIIPKYRLLPKSFGKYFGEFVFEVEEIIVKTNTLSFDEYIKARILHFIINSFWNTSKFDSIFKWLENHGYQNWDLIDFISKNLLNSKNENIDMLSKNFINETKNELFENFDSLYEFYSKEENFKLLEQSQIGDNIIYKYKSLANLYYWDDLCESMKGFLISFLIERNIFNNDKKEFINDLFYYIKYKYISGRNEEELFNVNKIQSFYDFISWEEDGCENDILKYKNDVLFDYQFNLEESIKEKMRDLFKIYPYSLINFPLIIRRTQIAWLQKTVKRYTSIKNVI